MKLFHTADWHLGKLVQGVYMTEDQRYVLEQLLQAIEAERPDAVIIAGDLYDRAVPPTEAVELLDELLARIVIDLNTPVLAISGNHDSPDRINFGTKLMESRGLHLVGQLKDGLKPVVLSDNFGEVHFHLVPYADPAQVRYQLGDESIRTHDDAMRVITARIAHGMDKSARHVFVGHAFITATGEPEQNTSDSERPLSVGGAEHVSAAYFEAFHYTALGHLHQAHFVRNDTIRYAGSPLKYSISEESHVKGYLVIELNEAGHVEIEKRELKPLRNMRRVIALIEEIEKQPVNEDYVFVTLLNENPVLFPMEKVRSVYPNALHVERRPVLAGGLNGNEAAADARGGTGRREADPIELFAAFYQEVKGQELSDAKKQLFADTYGELLREEGGVI
ncbi:exonuclease sbcCD subunit D [Paenibacillus sp. FSL H8-0548]|uniref:exonuclease SbcCD subunit D n=1 Tax=Paenibacillus sp. FSL H8-0548 TaxID=1920422 RepID=UPI00096E1762|nr:exonuclease SbcCD subunit D [Paenibacillus sp. FSL H8-0548]OMF31752.1 exonuclease sbcCD subunit D [Paenibacillus sp. FSL H8-0548]